MTASVMLLTLAVFLHFLPGLTRPAMFFGVTVDPAFRSSPAAAAIIRRYRVMMWISSVATLTAVLTTKRPEAVLLQVAGYYWATGVAHRHALDHSAAAEPSIEVNLAAPPESFPGGVFALLALLASYAVLALWTVRHWSRLPESFAVHWGMHGADRWIPRTPAAIGALLGQDLLISLLFLAVGFGILHRSRRASNRSSVAVEERRFRRTNVQAFLLMACFPAVMGWLIVLQPRSLGNWIIAAALLMLCIYYLILIPNRPRLSARSGDQTPDGCWKLGIFYVNPGDPAVFVVQRFGVGYTFNFGNRWTWAGLAMIVAAISVRAVAR